MRDIVRILRKRMWLMIAVAISVPVISGFYVYKQPKVFEAQTSIVIEATVPQYLGQSFRDVVDIEASWWSAQEMLQTELHILKSYSEAVAVAKELCGRHLTNDSTPALVRLVPGINCATDDYTRAAPLLQALVRLDLVKDSRVVNLTIDHTSPELAALLANTIAQVYTERNLERRLSQSEGAATWLGDEYGDLTQQLNDAETALIDFKKKNNIVAVALEDQQNDLSNKRKKISDELSTVQVRLIGVRSQRDEYAALQNDDPLNAVEPGVTDNPAVARLKDMYLDQYARVVEMKSKYLDKHPALEAAQMRLSTIRTDLAHEAGLAYKNVQAQYETLVKEEHELKVALEGATHEALQLEQRAIEYNRLKRNFDRLSKLSEQVGGRERETSLAGHLKTNNVRILDAALVPTSAIAPNVPRAVGVASLVGVAVAFALAFLLELLDSTVKTQDDIEKTLGLSFLGLIPSIALEQKTDEPASARASKEKTAVATAKDLYVLAHPKSSVAECCRSIRTNLLFMTPDHPAKSVLISSAGPQDGKTTAAVNLAITMAQSGLRVLLVDTDMRRPRLHKVFGIPSTSEGVSKAIVGECDILSVVRETGVPNLYLAPCGATPPNPAELLHADRFKKIVATLTEHYDRVIFDSPPVGVVTDAAILARLTDGTVLIAKAARTSRDALARARRAISGDGSSNVNILGCILNDLDLTKQGSYGYQYYYYSRYGYYYRDDEAAESSSAAGRN